MQSPHPHAHGTPLNKSPQVNAGLWSNPPVPLPAWMWRQVARATGLERLERMYRRLPDGLVPLEFVDAALQALEVSYVTDELDWHRLPSSGPLLVVANHPYGGIDGLAAISALLRRRNDLRVVATTALSALAPLRSILLPVDNFGRRDALSSNVIMVRAALRHVHAGGCLLLFPAGAVSHLDLGSASVVDPPWKRAAVRLISATGAPVAPLYVDGSNGAGFQLAGLLHPTLRTAMLPREITNKRGTVLDLRLGRPIAAERIAAIGEVEAIERMLRIRMYSLAAPRTVPRPADRAATAAATRAAPTAEEVPADLIECEIGNLGPDAELTRVGSLRIYCAAGARIPLTLEEIGRLRELSFRAVGEGTGNSRDLDRFDRHYDQLIAWDAAQRRIVGGYRAARIPELRRHHGRNALYLGTLFELSDPLFALLGPSIELGRSFVRIEAQRSFAPLLALWRGIGAYVGRHPEHSRLIGPVSVSADYGHAARELIVRYLRWHHFDPVLGAFVKPRSPFKPSTTMAGLRRDLRQVSDIGGLSPLLPVDDDTAREVPVLLRQYLKLGGRVIGFNVDAQFGDCIDCLTVVDLRRTPDAVLGKYMNEETLRRFRRRHGRIGGLR
ncbi:MAG: lysophospholipid acyltransferase family protein [Sinobacteraceae bacterium]|nr:lysophospholipid acyltransferase family protein [Nevskiaceae bacterium]